MNTKILITFAILFFASTTYGQDTVTVDQQAYWRSALRNNNSSQWDTIKN